MAVLVILDDLLMQTKIEAAAASCGALIHIATGAAALQPAAGPLAWEAILIDLQLEGDSLAIVQQLRAAAPRTPIIGFCSHIETALQRQAAAAGCTAVLPRSAFIRALPRWLGAQLPPDR